MAAVPSLFIPISSSNVFSTEAVIPITNDERRFTDGKYSICWRIFANEPVEFWIKIIFIYN